MKKISIAWFGFAALMAMASIFITACNKKFDEPPVTTNPGLTPTHSVKELKARHTVSGAYDLISDEVIIRGIVAANDKSGNLYKQIFIQDTTGGICVLIDRASLYGDYPVGREIFIKARGLYISDYRGLIQLGTLNNTIPTNPSFEGITTQLIDQYIVKGAINHPVVPKVVTISDLTTSMQNVHQSTLIQLNNYEIEVLDTSKTWADVSAAKNSGDIYARNCSGAGSRIDIRSSGFASFAGLNVPNGNGTITAIYTVFGSTRQLLIRDTSDVKMYDARCGSGPTTLISIEALKNMYTGTDITIATPTSVKGIVISDAATGKNISNGNLVLQDGNRGIDFFFGTSAAVVAQLATFHPGDSLVIDITGGTLTSYNGMIEMSMSSSAVPGAAVRTAANGAGLSVVPVQMTITEVINNIASIENTMVKIVNATAGPAGTYSGNKTLTDASGSMLLRTVATATFASSALPTTCQNWVGYVSRFNTDKQLYIRNPATDLSAGSGCTGGGTGGGGIALGTSPFQLNFDGIGSPLPTGVTIRNAGSATALGTVQTANTAANVTWGSFSGGAKVFASATGLTSSTDSATQSQTANRAIGYRQTGSNGDPGAAFVFELDNTTGKNNFKLEFKLQSLDATSPRSVSWKVDYGLGDAPNSFTTITTTGTATTGGSTFTNNTINADFGTALDNKSGKVWIRIIALTSSTGSGNRPSSAVDDFKLTWN
jgi:hypothetical protein